jgi:hypothetical protein
MSCQEGIFNGLLNTAFKGGLEIEVGDVRFEKLGPNCKMIRNED